MGLIMVGGQTKNVGKTTLVCNILAAFPELRWMAAKISHHPHRPKGCEMLARGDGWSIWQQTSTEDYNDTARFLRSGADRGILVQVEGRSLKDACVALKKQLLPDADVVLESAAAAEFLHPDLFLILVDAAQADFKQSAKQQLGLADAFVLRNAALGVPEQIRRVTGRPTFLASPNRLDPDLALRIAAILGVDV